MSLATYRRLIVNKFCSDLSAALKILEYKIPETMSNQILIRHNFVGVNAGLDTFKDCTACFSLLFSVLF